MSRNSTILTVASLLASAFAATTLAVAEPPSNPPAPGGGPKPGGEGRQRPKFEDLDKNKDGAITEDEVEKDQWERLKKRDKNNDGKITKDEFGQGGGGRPRGPKPGEDPKPS